MRTIRVDVAVAGGGIAGLWIANLLLLRGFDVALCDPGRAAGVQTRASQGLIHGASSTRSAAAPATPSTR